MLRVLIADTIVGVRSALRLLLEQAFNLQIVREVSESATLLRASQALVPHVILLDWVLPGLTSPALRQQLIAALRQGNACVVSSCCGVCSKSCSRCG